MNRARFSRISHTGMRFWNPLDETELLRFLRELPLADGDRVLDYGCGDGELLVELASRHDLRITGIDSNPEAIAVCREKIRGHFLAEPFRVELFETEVFDLVVNVGASPGFDLVVEQIKPLVRPGGRTLIGDGYWQGSPAPEYLSFLGASDSDMRTHEENCDTLIAAGFELERTAVSTLADWDRYEDRYDANMSAHLKAHPDDPEHTEFEERRSRWRAMYLECGRGTMGFALYQGLKSLAD